MPSKPRKPHPLDTLSFQPTEPADPSPTRPAQPEPAPAPQEEPTRSSNVTLPVSVWEWIDHKHAEARSAGGAPLRKSAIIRAAFLVAMAVDVDVAGSQTDEEIAQKIISAIAQSHS